MANEYYYDEVKHAGQILHKQYTDMMLKYEFDVELMQEDLGLDKTEAFFMNLVEKVPNFIQPYEELCRLYALYDEFDTELLTIEMIAFERTLALVTDKDGNFPTVMEYMFQENRPLMRFLNVGIEGLWEMGDLEESKELCEKLLRSDWMDNLGTRYKLKAMYEGMTLDEFDERFYDEEGYHKPELQTWFDNDFEEYPLLAEWKKEVVKME